MVQFLTKCSVPDEAKDHFMRHLRNKASADGGHVNFEMMFKELEECDVIKDEKTRELVGMVKPYILSKGRIWFLYTKRKQYSFVDANLLKFLVVVLHLTETET